MFHRPSTAFSQVFESLFRMWCKGLFCFFLPFMAGTSITYLGTDRLRCKNHWSHRCISKGLQKLQQQNLEKSSLKGFLIVDLVFPFLFAHQTRLNETVTYCLQGSGEFPFWPEEGAFRSKCRLVRTTYIWPPTQWFQHTKNASFSKFWKSFWVVKSYLKMPKKNGQLVIFLKTFS